MKSFAIVLWILCLVVAVAADLAMGNPSVSTAAFWIGSLFLWVGCALWLRGSALVRWGGGFVLMLVVGGLTYVLLGTLVLTGPGR